MPVMIFIVSNVFFRATAPCHGFEKKAFSVFFWFTSKDLQIKGVTDVGCER